MRRRRRKPRQRRYAQLKTKTKKRVNETRTSCCGVYRRPGRGAQLQTLRPVVPCSPQNRKHTHTHTHNQRHIQHIHWWDRATNGTSEPHCFLSWKKLPTANQSESDPSFDRSSVWRPERGSAWSWRWLGKVETTDSSVRSSRAATSEPKCYWLAKVLVFSVAIHQAKGRRDASGASRTVSVRETDAQGNGSTRHQLMEQFWIKT